MCDVQPLHAYAVLVCFLRGGGREGGEGKEGK